MTASGQAGSPGAAQLAAGVFREDRHRRTAPQPRDAVRDGSFGIYLLARSDVC